jgi:organic radical activating enzyme
MPKNQNESFLEYKERVIDPISPSFCAAKWLNATMWLDRGWTTSCHLPPHHSANKWQLLWNPSALHNTDHKKKMRKMMLNGERPSECDYCWKVEDMKKDAVSDRVFKTVIHSDEDIQKISKASPNSNVQLRTLEISFDRTCNFACSYCNAGFSTTWAQDIKKNGHYKLLSLGSAIFKMDGSDGEIPGDNNPYIKAFWKWWPELSQELKELRISGGEPLMSKECWKLLESFKGNPLKNLKIAMNSNLGAKDELIDRLIETSHHINHLEIYTSNESLGKHAEYIRDGINYERWKNNIHKLKKHGNIKRIHIMMTINALCLFSITDLFDDILSWRYELGSDVGHWTLNLLRFPSFMSSLVLPEEIRRERQAHLQNWLEKNKSHPHIQEMEIEGIYRLIQYLENIESPHSKVSPIEIQRSDFKSYYEQYDKRRGKNFKATFPPQLTDWVDSIPVHTQLPENFDPVKHTEFLQQILK